MLNNDSPKMNPASSRRTQSHKLREQVRALKCETILGAAEEVFAREGIEKARMETIAAKAGMAVGTLYNFFEDRATLVEALVDARSKGLADDLSRTLDANGDRPFAEQVQAYFETSLTHVEEHGRFWVELLRAHGTKRKDGASKSATRERLLANAARVIDAGIKQKVLKSECAELYAALLVGTVRSVLEHTASGRPCLFDKKTQTPRKLSELSLHLTDFFLHGTTR